MKNSSENGNAFSKNGNKDSIIVWDDIRVFLAVVRAGTISGAAQRTNLGLATVSRRVERLERGVGHPLFIRQQTGYELTEDGKNLVEKAEDMEATALSLTFGMTREAPVSGLVRLATAENLATELIIPELGRLRGRYPQLKLEILTDVATVNLHRRDADIALRMVRPQRGNVVVQRLGTLGYGLYAAPSYLSGRNTDLQTKNYSKDSFVSWTDAYANLPAAAWITRALKGRAPVLTTTSLSAQVSACRRGLGLAVLPHFVASPHGLVCLDANIGLEQPIWLVTQSDLAQSRRIKVVAEYLRSIVSDHRVELAGTGG